MSLTSSVTISNGSWMAATPCIRSTFGWSSWRMKRICAFRRSRLRSRSSATVYLAHVIADLLLCEIVEIDDSDGDLGDGSPRILPERLLRLLLRLCALFVQLLVAIFRRRAKQQSPVHLHTASVNADTRCAPPNYRTCPKPSLVRQTTSAWFSSHFWRPIGWSRDTGDGCVHPRFGGFSSIQRK